MEQFDLKKYVPQIVSMAETNNCGAYDAVEMFVVNLNSLSDHYKGAENLNFRELGQQWNRLNYKIRNKQRTDVVQMVAKKVMPATRPRAKEI